MLRTPNRNGYIVIYYTGEVKQFKNGETRRMTKSLIYRTAEERDEMVEKLKAEGKEIYQVSECIF